jgi:hypothetical protein
MQRGSRSACREPQWVIYEWKIVTGFIVRFFALTVRAQLVEQEIGTQRRRRDPGPDQGCAGGISGLEQGIALVKEILEKRVTLLLPCPGIAGPSDMIERLPRPGPPGPRRGVLFSRPIFIGHPSYQGRSVPTTGFFKLPADSSIKRKRKL